MADRAQLVGENSLYITEAQAQSMLQKLRTQYQVSISADKGAEAFLTNDLIYFLYDFFTQAKPKNPLQIVVSRLATVKLVSFNQATSQIVLSASAGDNLFATRLKKEARAKGIDLMSETVEMQLSYSNELLKQLFTVLDFNTKTNFIESYFKVNIKPIDNTFVEFRDRELNQLFSATVDIPTHSRKEMKIKHINRMLYGLAKFKGGGNVLAEYNKVLEQIRVYEANFEISTNFGEDTYAHELCHALSAGMNTKIRDQFYAISWVLDANNKWESKPGDSQFVTEYSTESAEEDFAESCGAYIVSGKALNFKAPAKYKFLKDKVFRGIEFSDVFNSLISANIKAILPEDKLPPSMSLPIDKTFKVYIYETKTNELAVEVEAFGLTDDVSGIKDVTVFIGKKLDSRFLITLKKSAGSKRYFGRKVIAFSEAPDDFTINSAFLEDVATNKAYIQVGKLFVPAKHIQDKINQHKSKSARPDIKFDFTKVKINSVPTDQGTVSAVEVPIKHTELFETIVFTFVSLKDKSNISFQTSHRKLLSSEVSKNILSKDGQNIKINTIIPAEVPTGDYELSYVGYYHMIKLSDDVLPPVWTYQFNNSQIFKFQPEPNLVIRHVGTKVKKTNPEINANNLKIKSKENNDGTVTVRIKVPVSNVTMGEIKGSIKVKGPDGRTFNGTASSINTDGTIDFDVQLPPHFTGGTYSVESIEVQEFPVIQQEDVETPREGDYPFGKTEQILKERSINREIKIEGPKLY